MAPLGPFVGGLLSIVFNRIYVDLSEPNIPMDDPKWISAWWAGLLVVLAPFAMLGPLLCLFPRRMRKKGTITIKMPCLRRLIRGKNADDDEEYKEDKKKIKTKLSKDEKKLKQEKERLEALEEENKFRKRSKEVFTLRRYPIALFRLLTTPIFMLIVFNSILSNFAWSGWPTFEMKYYYQIFRVPAWKITTINNVADLLLSPLGSLCGGIIISRLRPSYATVTLLTLFSFIFYAAIGVGRMFITCGDSNYAGFDYNGPAQLMGDCNAGCECGLEAYSPVCDNGLTYFTPCHAGGELGNNTLVDGVLQPDLQTFYNCICTETGFVVPGRCEGECDLVYLYVGLRAFSSFVWKLTRTVDILVIIRSVGFFEKAFALGLNSFLGTLLGSLPLAPVIGLIIDSACRVFQEIGGEEGSCWIYDTDQLRFRMYGYTLGIMALEIAVYLTIFYLAKKKNLQLFDEDDPITLEKRERAQKMGEIDDDNKESDESHNSNVNANSAELGDIEMTKEQNSSNHQTKL